MHSAIRLNKILRAAVVPVLAAFMLATLTGCSKSNEIVPGGLNEKGELVPFTSEQVSYDGMYYIKRGDLYYPLTSNGMEDNKESSYQWFTSKYNNYTPKFINGDSIVYIDAEERPSSTTLLAMKDAGYTVGTAFVPFQENGETAVQFSDDEFCPTSPIGNYIIKATNDDTKSTKIVEINGKPFTRNMLDENGFIQGLTEGAMYRFNFYGGTVYKDVSVMADTHLFLSSTEYSSTSYKPAKNIFYEVVLPENLPNGFYQIPGYGMFEYALEDNIILPNGIEVSGGNGDDAPPLEDESAATEQTQPAETENSSQE